MIRCISFLIIGCSLLGGCVHQSNVYEPQSFQVILSESDSIKIFGGIIVSSIDLDSAKVIHEIKFDRVIGGRTFFLGRFTLREGDGYKEKRLKIFRSDTTRERRYSINDLKVLMAKNPANASIDLVQE